MIGYRYKGNSVANGSNISLSIFYKICRRKKCPKADECVRFRTCLGDRSVPAHLGIFHAKAQRKNSQRCKSLNVKLLRLCVFLLCAFAWNKKSQRAMRYLLPTNVCKTLPKPVHLHRFAQHHPALNGDVAFFHEGDRDEGIGRCTDVVKRPVVIVARQHLAETLCPVDHRHFTVLPVEEFDPVMQLLFLSVDRDLDLDVLFAGKRRDRYSYVRHNVSEKRLIKLMRVYKGL